MISKLFAVLVAMFIVIGVKSLAEDQKARRIKPEQLESAIDVVGSKEAWESEPSLIVSSLDTIRKSKDIDAIPLLVAHVDYSPVDDEADTTMGNISKVYPVTSCLMDLGEESAHGVIDYLRKTDQRPSDKAMIEFRRVLVATLGKSRTTQLLKNENNNSTNQNAKKYFEELLQGLMD